MEQHHIDHHTPGETLHSTVREEGELFLIRILFLLSVLFVIIVTTLLLVSHTPQSKNVQAPNNTAEGSIQQLQVADALQTVQLEAKAAFVYDLDSEAMLYGKNEEAQLPLASLTKLMTILVAADLFKDVAAVTIDSRALTEDAGAGLLPSESWLPKDLFTFTLIQSSNGGARAIAGAAGAVGTTNNTDFESARERFVDFMNRRAKDLNLTQTYFINETGLDETTQVGGSYGSAKDVAHLMANLLVAHPELLEGTRHEALELSTVDSASHIAINTNTDLKEIPGLIGSKTGFTDLAGGNLVVVFDRGIHRPVVVSVLGSSKEGRFTDVKKLVDATLAALEEKTP